MASNPPPKILEELTECLALDDAIVRKVKSMWDDKPLMRLIAMLAVNKIEVDKCLIEDVKNDMQKVIHDLDDTLRHPHKFYMKLGIVIKSAK